LPQVIQFSASSGRNSASASFCPRYSTSHWNSAMISASRAISAGKVAQLDAAEVGQRDLAAPVRLAAPRLISASISRICL
jgi:hypothetical protein